MNIISPKSTLLTKDKRKLPERSNFNLKIMMSHVAEGYTCLNLNDITFFYLLHFDLGVAELQ